MAIATGWGRNFAYHLANAGEKESVEANGFTCPIEVTKVDGEQCNVLIQGRSKRSSWSGFGRTNFRRWWVWQATIGARDMCAHGAGGES